jgi:hypothetical protein
MVKNTGGNKSKKVARKNVYTGGGSTDVRRVADPCEMYAAITKIFSSHRCNVMGTDGNTYNCNIRGKFLKRKRTGDNALIPGVWVLIGFYEWEVRGDGSKNCDLLEIYSAMEKEKLKQLESHNLGNIMNVGEIEGSSNITFSNFHVEEEKEKESSEQESVDEETTDEESAPVINSPVIIETAKEQQDWLTIDERDI